MVTVGIDPHKHLHVALALAENGTRLGRPLKIEATTSALVRLLAWARALAQGQPLTFAIEGGPSLARRLADGLLLAGQPVVWVPPRHMATHRALAGPTGAKSDTTDAAAVARAAIATPTLARHRIDEPIRDLRLLVDARAQAVKDRTAVINRLKTHLHLHLDDDPGDLTRPTNTAALGDLLSTSPLSATTRTVLTDMVTHLHTLTQRIGDYEKLIAEQVRPLAPHLLAIRGIGPVRAGVLLAEIGDITRFANAAKLARYSGCAPIPVYSSDQVRHRLHRGGNRRLNHILHQIALTQGLFSPQAATFLHTRRPTKGKRGAYRALKRHLIDIIYHAMTADRATWTHPITQHQTAA